MGKKRIKGEGVNYSEVKVATTFRLTPTAIAILKETARSQNTSQAEILEKAIREIRSQS